MPQLLHTRLHQHRDRAVSLLGLPAHHAITHADVNRAFTLRTQGIADRASLAAWDFICDLAHEHVQARGWRHRWFTTPRAPDQPEVSDAPEYMPTEIAPEHFTDA